MYHFTAPPSPAGHATASLVNHQPGQGQESPGGNWKLIASALLFLALSLPLCFAAPSLSAGARDTTARSWASTGITTTAPNVTLADTGKVFTLTVLHTNDTWGYLDPCG